MQGHVHCLGMGTHTHTHTHTHHDVVDIRIVCVCVLIAVNKSNTLYILNTSRAKNVNMVHVIVVPL